MSIFCRQRPFLNLKGYIHVPIMFDTLFTLTLLHLQALFGYDDLDTVTLMYAYAMASINTGVFKVK